MRTILLSVALLLLPVAAVAVEPAASDAATAIAKGDRLRGSDKPLDLHSAILEYDRAIRTAHTDAAMARLARERIEETKRRLQDLARPARDLANAALEAQDLIEAERHLVDAGSIDPFDRELRSILGDVRTRLRHQAVELQRRILEARGIKTGHLGIPPDAERITNDPRYALPPRTSHAG